MFIGFVREQSPLGQGGSLYTIVYGQKYVVLLHSEVVESKLVKLETSRAVILPPTVSVFCTYSVKRNE